MIPPILFLIYNRPQYTKEVFEAIRRIKPKHLYISADGPKKNKEGDKDLCEESRKIATQVDWRCEVKTLFRDDNLGCKLGISSGIDWFFGHVEEGIILEDDCLPNESFFIFCKILLEKYRENDKIMMIGGSNPAISIEVKNDYFYSRFYTIWGWATWKRAWNKFDINLSKWPQIKFTNFLDSIYINNLENRKFTEKIFDETYINKQCTYWAVQWSYSCMTNKGVAILPRYNLIKNVGFIGTHEMNGNQLCLSTKEIDFKKFTHPVRINIDNQIEEKLFKASGLS